MTIRSLIFDLDGTLVDSAALVGAILNTMRAEKNLPPLDDGFYRHWSSRGGPQLVGRALAIEPADADAQVIEFRRRYRERPTPLESVFPGVAETLAACQAAGLALAICSNKPEHLCRKVLSETGLDIFFPVIVGGDTTGFGKPHRAPLDHAMAGIAAGHASTWLIGDSSVDQKTAAAVGVGFVYFTGGYDDGVDRTAITAMIETIPGLLALRSIRDRLPLRAAE